MIGKNIKCESCAYCGSTGWKAKLPRLMPSWKGWNKKPAHQGLQMLSDHESIWVLCNDCEVKDTMFHWLITGVWRYPLKRK